MLAINNEKVSSSCLRPKTEKNRREGKMFVRLPICSSVDERLCALHEASVGLVTPFHKTHMMLGETLKGAPKPFTK